MHEDLQIDDTFLRGLPLPIAQLYRRALNAKTSLERHQAAYYVWEAALKLLGSVAIVEYAERFTEAEEHDPELAARLHNLMRPSLGHWWEFVRRLVPILAEQGDEGFGQVNQFLLGRSMRDDLPRTAGLDGALLDSLEGKSSTRTTVRPRDLFDHLVRYRNQEVGHGAIGQKPDEHYDRMGSTLLVAAAEFLGRMPLLAGRTIIHVADVRRLKSGDWQLEQYELIGENARRLEPLNFPADQIDRLPTPERLYVRSARSAVGTGSRGSAETIDHRPAEQAGTGTEALISLHPLIVYDVEAGDVLFLNARRGRRRVEHLSYVSGQVRQAEDLVGIQHELLARVLDVPVDDASAEQWTEAAEQEEVIETPQTADEQTDSLRRVGEFELLAKVGVGGMGDVYRAWQPSLGRQVALKCMRRVGDPNAEARFAREIRALGKVEHPNLVKIFTSGSEADRWFYAMEMVEGAPLSGLRKELFNLDPSQTRVDDSTWQQALETAQEEVLNQQNTLSQAEGLSTAGISSVDGSTWETSASTPGRFITHRADGVDARGSYVTRVVEIIRQVTEASHALHQAGIVHRDIKPENIVITPDGGHAVLMDLGLAKLTDDDQTRLTRTRQFVGTLRYASPEQVLAAGDIDCRSDVYSLGVILWELLALRPIYNITEETATPELMRRIQFDEPESIRKHQSRVSVDLDAIVLKCLEKNPQRRYASALDLADDLVHWQNKEPVTAKRRSLASKASRKLWRGRKGLAITTAVLAAVIGIWYWAVFVRIDPYTALRREEIRRMYERIVKSPPQPIRTPHKSRKTVETLPPDNANEFEVIERSHVWDMRAWKPVDVTRLSELHSAQILIARSRLRKLRPTTELRTQGRSYNVLYSRVLSHPDAYYVLASEKPVKVGGVIMKATQTVIDVSSVPVGEEFTVKERLTFWNSMIHREEFWCGTIVRTPILKVSFMLITSADQPFKSYNLRVAELDGDQLLPYEGEQFVFADPDRRYIFWEIARPKPGYVYRIDWDW